MALVSTSQNVLDQSATPITKQSVQKKGAPIRIAFGNLAAASFVGGTVGQWYTFVRVPVRAQIVDIQLTGATTTTGAVKCGLYRTDGIAIDDDVFATVYATSVEKDGATILATPTNVERTQTIADAYATAITTAGAQNDVEVDIALAIVTVLGASIAHTMAVLYTLPE